MSTTDAVAAMKTQPKITLIWLEKSRANRIVWLLEECGLEYDVKIFKRTKSYLAPPELKEYHPLGKAPILMVDGRALAESGPICEYIIDNFGPHLKPSDPKSEAWLQYRYYMHYPEGTMMPYLVMTLIAGKIRQAPIPFFLKFVTNGVSDNLMKSFVLPNMTTQIEFLEKELSTRKYLAGDELSGADFMMSFPFEALQSGRMGDVNPMTKEKCPHIYEYLERWQSRPAYQTARKKVKEYEASTETEAKL